MTPTEKPPIWRDVRYLAWAFQLVALTIVVAVIATLVNNVRVNSANLGVPLGFDFLDQPSSFEIPANDFRSTQSVKVALFEGALNTLRVALLGLVLATILGVLVGIGRLSGNWLIRTVSSLYVEIIRNIPLLGIVIFAYLALVLSALPSVAESWDIGGLLITNTRGTSVPWFTGPALSVIGAAALAGVVGFFIRRWRLARLDQFGEAPNVGWWVTPAVLLVFFWTMFFLGIGVTTPMIDGRRVTGGMTMQPEYFALLFALVIYTASHIAEIVRGSIQAVPKGQAEASIAMALSPLQRMRHIILPQAMRIALPPLGNQYLNLMKNSSLGFVISYFELTKVTSTTIGNRSPAVPAYLLMMLLYLIASLLISSVVNYFNRRLRLN